MQRPLPAGGQGKSGETSRIASVTPVAPAATRHRTTCHICSNEKLVVLSCYCALPGSGTIVHFSASRTLSRPSPPSHSYQNKVLRRPPHMIDAAAMPSRHRLFSFPGFPISPPSTLSRIGRACLRSFRGLGSLAALDAPRLPKAASEYMRPPPSPGLAPPIEDSPRPLISTIMPQSDRTGFYCTATSHPSNIEIMGLGV
jgi:hypothetical protein